MRTIKINKKDKPFQFSFRALREFENLTGAGLRNITYCFTNQTGNFFDYITKVAYCGFKAGAKEEGQEFESSEEDIVDWIQDDLNTAEQGKTNLILKVQEIFWDDMEQFIKAIADDEEETEKKTPEA